MTVGALLHLGLPLEAVRDAVRLLRLEGVDARAEPTRRCGIAGVKFQVRVHGRHPDRPDAEAAHRGGHHRRSYPEIRRLLEESALPDPVRTTALAIFLRRAEAEARAFGIDPLAVEFHGPGALDAIVDIVGTALGIAHLGIERVYVGALPLGAKGVHMTSHGPLPVPAPTVLELLRGWPVRLEGECTELVTPTGAAIVAALARRESIPPIRLAAVGYGAGDQNLPDRPNLLRILLGEPLEG